MAGAQSNTYPLRWPMNGGSSPSNPGYTGRLRPPSLDFSDTVNSVRPLTPYRRSRHRISEFSDTVRSARPVDLYKYRVSDPARSGIRPSAFSFAPRHQIPLDAKNAVSRLKDIAAELADIEECDDPSQHDFELRDQKYWSHCDLLTVSKVFGDISVYTSYILADPYGTSYRPHIETDPYFQGGFFGEVPVPTICGRPVPIFSHAWYKLDRSTGIMETTLYSDLMQQAIHYRLEHRNSRAGRSRRAARAQNQMYSLLGSGLSAIAPGVPACISDTTTMVQGAASRIQADASVASDSLNTAANTLRKTAESWNFETVISRVCDGVKTALVSDEAKATRAVLILVSVCAILVFIAREIKDLIERERKETPTTSYIKVMTAFVSSLALVGCFFEDFKVLGRIISDELSRLILHYSDKLESQLEAKGILSTGSHESISSAPPAKLGQGVSDVKTCKPSVDGKEKLKSPEPEPLNAERKQSRVIEPLKGTSPPEGKARLEAGTEEADLWASLAAISWTFGEYLANPIGFDITNQLTKMRGKSSGFKTFLQAIKAISIQAPEYYRITLYKVSGYGMPDSVEEEDKQLIEQCYALLGKVDIREEKTPGFKAMYMYAYSELGERTKIWSIKNMNTKSNGFLAKLGVGLYNQMRAKITLVESIPDDVKLRPVPVALYLYGDSGVGKTFLCRRLADLFYSGPQHKAIYYKNPNEDFASGYKGQWAWISDDFGADIKLEQEKHSLSNLFTRISSATCVENMPFDKGRMYTSRVHVLNSNTSLNGVVQALDITNGNAVLRRFSGSNGMTLECRVKPKFRQNDVKSPNSFKKRTKVKKKNGSMVNEKFSVADKKKVDAQTDAQKDDFNHVDFFLVNPFNRKREKLTFSQVVSRFSDLYVMSASNYVSELKGAMRASSGNQFGAEAKRVRAADEMVIDAREVLLQTEQERRGVGQNQMKSVRKIFKGSRKKRARVVASNEGKVEKDNLAHKNEEPPVEKVEEKSEGKIAYTPREAHLTLCNNWEKAGAINKLRVILDCTSCEGCPAFFEDAKVAAHFLGHLAKRNLLSPAECKFFHPDNDGDAQEEERSKHANPPEEKESEDKESKLAQFLVPPEGARMDKFNEGHRRINLLIKEFLDPVDVSKLSCWFGEDVTQPAWITTMLHWADGSMVKVVNAIKAVLDHKPDPAAVSRHLRGVKEAKKASKSIWARVADIWKRRCDAKLGLKGWGGIVATIGLVAGLVTVSTHLMRPSGENQKYARKRTGKSNLKKLTREQIRRLQSSATASNQGDQKQIFPYIGQLRRSGCGISITFRNRDGSYTSHEGRATMIATGVALVNRHYLMTEGKLLSNGEMVFDRQGVSYHWQYKSADVKEILNEDGKPSDLVLLLLPEKVGTAPSLWKHFPKKTDLRPVYGDSPRSPAYLMTHDEVSRLERPAVGTDLRSIDWDQGEQAVRIQRGLYYPVDSARGDCGTLIATRSHIVGVHCAGMRSSDGTKHGLAQVVTREELEKAMKSARNEGFCLTFDNSFTESSDFFRPHAVEPVDMRAVPEGAFIPSGTICLTFGGANKSKIVRSQMTGKTASMCKKRPAPMNKGDPACPAWMREDKKHFVPQLLKKFSKLPTYESPFIDVILDYLVSTKVPVPTCYPGVWSIEQALNPQLAKSGRVKPIPRSTGAGAMWEAPGKRGKLHLIDFDEDKQLYVAVPELANHVKVALAKARTGEVPPDELWKPFVKDEVLSDEKIARVGAREVTGCPVSLTILGRCLCGAFVDAFMADPVKWGHFVGLNMYGPDYDRLTKHMLAISAKGFPTDVRGFDSTVTAEFIVKLFKAIDDWYKTHDPKWTHADRLARVVLAQTIAFNYSVVGSTIFQKCYGNNSGNWITTILNCFRNKAMDIDAYFQLVPVIPDLADDLIPIHGFEGYEAYVYQNCLGDDGKRAVHPAVGDYFNQATFCEFFQDRGIQVTPPDKEAKPSHELEDLLGMEYLSCRTTPPELVEGLLPGVSYYPWISDKSSAKCIAYVRPSNDLPESVAVASNIKDVLDRVWFSGRDRFDEVRNDLVRDYHRSYPGCDLTAPTYSQLLSKHAPFTSKIFGKARNEGVTFSSTQTKYHVGSLVDSSIENNPSTAIEAKTDVDAKANMDNPNLGLPFGGIVRAGYPLTSTAQGISYGQPMTITQEITKPDHDLFGGVNDCTFKDFTRLTWFDAVTVNETTTQGAVVASWPLVPNQLMVGAEVDDVIAPSSLCYLANMHTYWRGSLKYSFHYIIPTVGRARFAFTVLYDIHDPVTQITNLMAQGSVIMDVGSDSKVFCVEVPYNAPTHMLQTYRGQNQPRRYSMGTAYLVMLNAYRVPDSAPSTLHIEMFEGSGSDFDVRVPFGVNASLTIQNPPIPELDGKAVNEMLTSDSAQVPVNASSGADQAIQMHVKMDQTIEPPELIVKYPQTFRTLARRPYHCWTAQDDFLIPHGMVLSFDPDPNVSESGTRIKQNCLATILAPFKLWTGSLVYKMFSNESHLRVWYRGAAVGEEGWKRFVGGNPPARGSGIPWVGTLPEVGYLEFIVPFASRYGSLVLNDFKKTDNEISYAGDIIVNGVEQNDRVSTFVSAGDGFFFGVPCILPDVRVATNISPDNYPDPPPFLDGKAVNEMDAPIGGEDLTPAHDEAVGTIMAETAPVESKITDLVPSQAYEYIAQPQLSFVDFFNRRQLMAVTSWTTTQTVGDTLFNRDVPFGLMTNTAERAQESFRLGMFDEIEFTVTVTGTPFHAGRLIVYFVPLGDISTIEHTHSQRKNSATFVPHVFLDAVVSGSATLVIPYRYVAPMLRNSTNQSFGAIGVSVFTPLTVGTGGNTTLPLTIFTAFKNVQTRIINPTSLT